MLDPCSYSTLSLSLVSLSLSSLSRSHLSLSLWSLTHSLTHQPASLFSSAARSALVPHPSFLPCPFLISLAPCFETRLALASRLSRLARLPLANPHSPPPLRRCRRRASLFHSLSSLSFTLSPLSLSLSLLFVYHFLCLSLIFSRTHIFSLISSLSDGAGAERAAGAAALRPARRRAPRQALRPSHRLRHGRSGPALPGPAG
jgi:hypothetical protein